MANISFALDAVKRRVASGTAAPSDFDQLCTVEVCLPANENVTAPEQSRPTLISPSSLVGRAPAREWIVPDWLPCGVVTGLYGDGGLGKSLLALQLQTALAIGKPWLGLSAEKVASLGVYCEDSQEELWRRQEDINSDYGIAMMALSDVHWMPRLGEDNLIMVFARNGVGEFTKFHGEILTAALDFRARHVSIDTAADTFGGNEIDRNHVRQYVSRACGSIARKINGSVMVCAHPSVSGITSGEGTSGSTGWNNSFRSRLFFRAPDAEKGEAPDPNARILDRKKANYAARNDQIKLRWRSGVINTEAPIAPGTTAFGSRSARDVFLDLLDEFGRMKRPLSDNSKSGNYAPRVFGKLPRDQRNDYREADFNRAMEVLFRSRDIENIDYGKPSDVRRKIGRSA